MGKHEWTKEKRKKRWILWGSIFIILLILSLMMPKDVVQPQPSSAPKQINWTELSYEQQQQWIEQKLKSATLPSGFYSDMMEGIRSKFKFPDEVDFIDVPFGGAADITMADTGMVFFHGLVVAKNAFGVKGRYAYSVRTFIRPDTVYIDNISVSER